MVSNSSPLLINESPLQVLPSLAVALGNINEAIILQQIQYWLKNPKSGRLDDQGRKYVRDTVSEWNAQFPWLTDRAIKTRLKSLEEKGVVLTANLNKSKYDRTKWYSIDYDVLNNLVQMHSEETSPSKVKKNHDEKGRNFPIQSEESYQPIPKTSTKTSSNNSTKNNSSSKDEHIPYKEIIDYLNQKTGAHYKATSSANQRLIKARFKEGYKLDDFKKVINNKAFEWQHTDMWQFMRPSTLFSPSHFDDYLNANNLDKHKNKPTGGGYDSTQVDLSDVNDNDLPF